MTPESNRNDVLSKALLAGLATEDEDADDDRAMQQAHGLSDDDMYDLGPAIDDGPDDED